MNSETIYDFIYMVAPYAPAVILVASMLDIFFITGLIFYGAAMLGSVGMLHATGMINTETLIAVALVGTVSGNCLNYLVGRLFGQTTYIANKLETDRAQKARDHLTDRGLLLFIIIGRFITFTRPLYALLLGSLKIPFKDFLIRELPVALVWVTFWLFIILKGEELYFKYLH